MNTFISSHNNFGWDAIVAQVLDPKRKPQLNAQPRRVGTHIPAMPQVASAHSAREATLNTFKAGGYM